MSSEFVIKLHVKVEEDNDDVTDIYTAVEIDDDVPFEYCMTACAALLRFLSVNNDDGFEKVMEEINKQAINSGDTI